MKKIYKYQVPASGWIEIPKGGQILDVRPQDGFLCAWVMFAPNDRELNPTVWSKIMVYGTGHDIPMSAKYINTYFDDPFVWHVHELERAEKVDRSGDE